MVDNRYLLDTELGRRSVVENRYLLDTELGNISEIENRLYLLDIAKVRSEGHLLH